MAVRQHLGNFQCFLGWDTFSKRMTRNESPHLIYCQWEKGEAFCINLSENIHILRKKLPKRSEYDNEGNCGEFSKFQAGHISKISCENGVIYKPITSLTSHLMEITGKSNTALRQF